MEKLQNDVSNFFVFNFAGGHSRMPRGRFVNDPYEVEKALCRKDFGQTIGAD